MGLIKAGINAIGGTLADQWKEYFYCESMGNNILVAKGKRKVNSRSSNTKGDENVITNGSGIAVADGQCMIIVEDGKVVEICSEPGEFTFDMSSEPSIFTQDLGDTIQDTLDNMLKRFTYGGMAGKDQRIYYFNIKEIMGNKFGTQSPIPFRVIVDENLGMKMSVDLRANGEYSYKIVDPLLFYKNVSGNVTSYFERSQIDSMLKSELLNALQPALAKLTQQKIMYYEIPAHTKEITQALREELSVDWKEKRGIEVVSLALNSVTIPDEQRQKITAWEENVMLTNPTLAGAHIVGGQVSAMNKAAENKAGALNGFMGMNMANNMGTVNAGDFYAMGNKNMNSPSNTVPSDGKWICVKCGATATGKFCSQCGAPKPESKEWFCSNCGTKNSGKFCSECANPRP
ncbi:SPFH domain-containing protein [Criibacterium bergeronii]|uniref:SPFH domain-containing protein n=1 Tax=Criibacterium bergeronii TaxID=1871336 RepID=A0A371IJK8_9FIRM|nr:SPFH domain-containing protein [Criibacterium bergeronii]RDY20650.1 SPFH domain-containing protein [Criibacterium bergeronii]TRW27059.1 SPFH domain-containing protein [Criibacterium bergeronii]